MTSSADVTDAAARPHWRWLVLLALWTIPVVLSASAVLQKSVTVDEFQALPHGLALLKTGDFRLATTTQPLPQYLPALPLLFTDARLDSSRLAGFSSTWELGKYFMEENRADYQRYFTYGRMVSILVLCATCLLAYGFSRSLYGATGGLLTAAIAAFSPALLAHGALVTPDIYLTASVVAALWAFDDLLRRPGWRAGGFLGLAMGAACLAKLTGIFLFFLLPVLLAGFYVADRWRKSNVPASGRLLLFSMVLALVVGLFVINLGCLFEGSLTPLGNYTLDGYMTRKLQEVLPGWLPVPLPYAIFKGIDFQLSERGYVAYLLGKFNNTGFYQYYLVGLLVKTPVPVLVLGLLALVFDPRLHRRELPMVVCGLLLLCFFSLSRHKNIGMRYVLFLEPLMAVWIGRLAALPAWTSLRWRRGMIGAAAGGVVCLFASAVLTWPNYLAYFNLASGGPARGHRYLLDSNLDWGQDLIALRRYMDRQGIASVDLAYFGRVDPAIYGVHFRHLGLQPVGRYVAISANLLWGRTYVMNGNPGLGTPRPDAFSEFRELKPAAVLGHTIYVYDLAHMELGK
jgi:hypothetical protein